MRQSAIATFASALVVVASLSLGTVGLVTAEYGASGGEGLSASAGADPVTASAVGSTSGAISGADATETPAAQTSGNITNEQILSGLSSPTAIEFLPDGRMLVLQKNGVIYIADPETGESAVYMDISGRVKTRGERGLLDITLDPDFGTNGYLYVYYTNSQVSNPGTNRIARFTHTEGSGGLSSDGDASSETLIWENPSATENCCHFGGGLDIGPDDKLYLTTGEEFEGQQAQNLSKADGKVIRVNRDGTIPVDNPFVDDASALDSIWALGLRNPFRAEWDQQTERLFIGEVGGNNNTIAQEDVNLGQKGANYGWPECQGFCDNPDYTDPVYSYPHNGSGASVTGGFVYRGNQFPNEYSGAYILGDYVNGWIKYLTFNSSGGVESVNTLSTSAGAVVHLAQGPNGSIYYADIADGTVERLVYSADNEGPEIQTASATPTSGAPPLAVNFTADATDPDGDSLSYYWVFGDGSETDGQNVSHTYSDAGQYTAYVEVSDGEFTATSDPIKIVVGTPPNATITAPANESLFRAGDVITFEGNGTDAEDGTIDGSKFSWSMDFLHNEHTHPAIDGETGESVTYEVPTSGHDYNDDTGYEMTLTVTDSDGLTDSDSVAVYPDKADLTFRTEPGSLKFKFDDISRTAPYTHDSLIGFNHTVAAPDQCADNTQYVFRNWSDGGARSHTITTPESDTTYTANYEAVGDCSGSVPADPVLRLESDQGVSTSGSTVTEWADQSGLGNDLSASGDPALVSNSLGGEPIISFDGGDDLLERTSALNGFATGSANRSMLYVVRYNETGFGGLAYGSASCNNAFGTIVSDTGDLTVQGWCSANDYPTDVVGTDAGWMTQSVILAGDSFTHYKNGTAIDSGTQTFDTTDNKLVVGGELTPPPYLDMDVAAVYVYNRSLSESGRLALENYVENKYFSESTNEPPTANDDSASVDQGQSVTVDVLANDTDSDGSLNPSSVTIQQSPANGTVSVNDSTGAVNYTHDGSDAASDSFTYTVEDDDGATSNEATVGIDVTIATNEPPTANDDSASVTQGGSVVVDVLANDTDADGSLDPSSVTIQQSPTSGTVTVDDSTGTVNYTHDGSDTTSDSFTYTVDDDDGATSNEATVDITVTTGDTTGSVPSAPVLRLESDQGVSTSGSTVTEWADQSGLGNDLSASGDPALVSNSLGGEPIVSFDGGDDVLQRTGLDGFATGSADRTMLYVVRYNETGFGGLAYGSANCNNAFGTIVSDTGDLTVQGWCSGNDYPTSIQGTDAGWMTQSVVLSGDSFTHYKNGTAIDSGTQTFDTTDNNLVLGGELTPPPYLDMDVAAVYVYNRSLSETERSDLETYVQNKYFSESTNEPPTANDDSASVEQGNSVVVDVLANDTDSDGTLNPSSVTIQQSPTSGAVSVNDSTGAVNYTHDGSDTTSDSFTYTVEDDDGAASNAATVDITVTTTNEAPTANDDSASVDQGQSVIVDVLANDTDSDGSLNPSSVSIQQSPANGTVSVNDSTGAVNYTHDGFDAASDSFTYTVDDDDGATSNEATVGIDVTIATNEPPTANDDSARVTQGDSVVVDVLANDTDSDGSLNPSSVTIQQSPANGSVSVDASTGAVNYTHDGSDATSDSFTYTVDDDDGATSNEATVDIDVDVTTSEGLPVTSGLVLHLESDQGVSTSGSTVTSWADQSGLGNDLSASGDPALVSNVLGGEPIISFDGGDDFLERTSSLTGFATGSANRSMLYVVQYNETGFGGLAYGSANCNNAFGTIVSDTGDLTVQGWCSANDYPTDVVGTDAGWMTQSVVLAGDSFTHYKNGTAIDSGTQTFDTTDNNLVLGSELTPPPYLDMDVAAVYVYNRSLSETERSDLETYVQNKYFGG